MTSTSTVILSKVRNYEGSNQFLQSLKFSYQKWGRLTDKQMLAAENALKSSEKKLDINLLSEDLRTIANYEGQNSFVLDIKSKLLKYGTLSDKQIMAAESQIKSEINKLNTVNIKIPTPGETVMVGRKIGQKLKTEYDLQFNPMILDITKLLAISPRAVKFSGKMTISRGNVCRCCAKTLTDEFSMLTGVGKKCAELMGVEYIKDKSQTEKFRNEYLRKVEEIGEMEFWVPKSQIKKWEGKTEIMLDMI